MKFAITGFDLYFSTFEAFLEAGWQPVKLFSWPVDNLFDHNKAIVARAAQAGIPIQLSRMNDDDLADLGRRGCEVLIGAGYAWKILDWRPHIPHAVNFHPAPLPDARGPYPAIRAIEDEYKSWAITCHKFDMTLDTGDILAQREFPLSATECHESLTMKIQMNGKALAREVAGNFKSLWDHATPQVGGSYWKRWTDEEQTLDFTQPVDIIMRKIRAFGLVETMALVNNVKIYVKRAVGWTEAHNHIPGSIVMMNGQRAVVAARDGYIGLVEWSYVTRQRATEMGRYNL